MIKPMDNLISRQAAIDAIADFIHNVDIAICEGSLSDIACKEAAQSVLEEIPSEELEIIQCKDCKWYDINRHQCDIQPCAKFYEFDFCSRGERKDPNENTDSV